MKDEQIMLKDASAEIKQLRKQNELMSARLDMFDSINAMLHTEIARKNQGMSPDLCSEIDKYLASKNA